MFFVLLSNTFTDFYQILYQADKKSKKEILLIIKTKGSNNLQHSPVRLHVAG